MATTDRRASLSVAVDGGTAELVPDHRRPRAWILMIEGVAQSYVDLDDPAHLEFEYVRRVANVIDTLASPRASLKALHLGGGAMTLPRYVASTRPGSEQVVVERDPAITLLMHRELPLPQGADIEVRITDGRTAVDGGPDGEFDLIITDAYEGATMPRDMTSLEYVRQVARILRPTGTYIINVTDLPILAFTRIQAAALRDTFADVCVVAEIGMLRGRRFGNVVLAATHQAGGLRTRAMARARTGEVAPARVVHGDALTAFIGGAHAVSEGNPPQVGHAALPSPDRT
jgi:spermidine synthase